MTLESTGLYVMVVGWSFLTVFLKGFQHKNVNSNLYMHTFLTSYVMAFADVLLVGIIAKSDWTIAFAAGTGASFGMVTAMYIHNRFVTGVSHGNSSKAAPATSASAERCDGA